MVWVLVVSLWFILVGCVVALIYCSAVVVALWFSGMVCIGLWGLCRVLVYLLLLVLIVV